MEWRGPHSAIPGAETFSRHLPFALPHLASNCFTSTCNNVLDWPRVNNIRIWFWIHLVRASLSNPGIKEMWKIYPLHIPELLLDEILMIECKEDTFTMQYGVRVSLDRINRSRVSWKHWCPDAEMQIRMKIYWNRLCRIYSTSIKDKRYFVYSLRILRPSFS